MKHGNWGPGQWTEYQRLKALAYKAVAHALKTGVFVRPAHCEECPSTKGIEAHHDDYSKPLEVRWLCEPCHEEVHGYDGPEPELDQKTRELLRVRFLRGLLRS